MFSRTVKCCRAAIVCGAVVPDIGGSFLCSSLLRCLSFEEGPYQQTPAENSNPQNVC